MDAALFVLSEKGLKTFHSLDYEFDWLIDWLIRVLRPAQEFYTYMETSMNLIEKKRESWETSP
jgi:hypothetical protein